MADIIYTKVNADTMKITESKPVEKNIDRGLLLRRKEQLEKALVGVNELLAKMDEVCADVVEK